MNTISINHTSPHSFLQKIGWGILSLVLLSYFSFSGAYLWQAYEVNKLYLAEIHQSQNEVEVKGVERMAKYRLLSLHRSLAVFVNTHQELIAQLSKNPKDEVLYDLVGRELVQYFPEIGGFTIANADGDTLFEDIEGTISDMCKRDIKRFEMNPKSVLLQLHPNSNFPHVDIMEPFKFEGLEGVFYINIPAQKIVDWLHSVTFDGTHTLLVKIDEEKQEVLIDFSHEGYRYSYDRQWKMTLQALKSLPYVAMQKVPETLWTAVAYTSENALEKDYQVLQQAMMRAFWVIVLLGFIFLPVIVYFNLKATQAQSQVAYLAFHDPLTGLLNRSQFNEQLAQSIRLARREGHQLAVLFLDLNGFKPINDTYGHQVGDEVLKVVAERLTQALRQSDVVARVGGDEFVVVLNDIRDKGDVLKVVQKLEEAIEAPIEVMGKSLSVSASIGYALLDESLIEDADEAGENLVKQADMLMYDVKQVYHQKETEAH